MESAINQAPSKSCSPFKMVAFDYRNVTLLDGLFKSRYEVNREYLLSLDCDSLLFPYRAEAALPHWSYPLQSKPLAGMSLTDAEHFTPNDPALARAMAAEPYGGWEHPTFIHRGHFMGHYLSACARIYATSKDAELKRRADYIIEELAKCQDHNGNGYVGSIPERFLDILERGSRFDLDRDHVIKKGLAFLLFLVPYYVLHKVLMGLVENYKVVGNIQALHVATKMVEYIQRRVVRLSDAHMQRILDVEFGGMPELLYDLYVETGDEQHLALARRFEYRRFLGPLSRNEDCLKNVHGNATIPKIIGAARAFEVTGEPEYRDIAFNFWDIIRTTRTYATGGSTIQEYWKEANQLKDTLSPLANQETCTSYNWLCLTKHLLRWTADAKYADMCERILFNGILSIQNPADGTFAYYTPLAPGAKKGGPFLDRKFGTRTDSFWCCSGTSVQAFADLADGIYYSDADGIFVNLFVPSEVRWSHAGKVVRIKQTTQFPETGATRITVETTSGPVRFALCIRVPWWVRTGMKAMVNGELFDQEYVLGTFLEIGRKWQDGDVVDVTMPMTFYAEPINDAPDLVAVMYGPLVMAGLTSKPIELKGGKTDLAGLFEPIPGQPLRFQTRGQRPNVTFVPLFRVIDEEYGVYFRVTA